MKNFFYIGLTALVLYGCACKSHNEKIPELTLEETSVFSSTDKTLEKSYIWAKKMALSYSHDGKDPVGLWYEAALPQREAFCMRDVSHQSVGAQILGLKAHNKNMFTRFAENISEGKDWCSYWEINRYNQPAPADYTNDKEFWYNLNANFDVMFACLKMYEWTGDNDYLTDSVFTNFYDKTLDKYLAHWKIDPDNIMTRPRYMHQPENFDMKNNFHTCRGLGSYVENFRGLTVGVDLISALYAGCKAHSRIAALTGNGEIAERDIQLANSYQKILEEQWWDSSNSRYYTFWTENREFHRGEGVPFILWFGATQDNERLNACVSDILAEKDKWNVENMSAFPVIFYRLGYDEEAYSYLVTLPQMNRCEYPEVSFGVVEGVVGGMMGISPSASQKTISTCSHLTAQTKEAEVKNVPVFDGYITVKHKGTTETFIQNNTGLDLTWNASFLGNYPEVEVDGKTYPAIVTQDCRNKSISTVKVKLEKGKGLCAKVLSAK